MGDIQRALDRGRKMTIIAWCGVGLGLATVMVVVGFALWPRPSTAEPWPDRDIGVYHDQKNHTTCYVYDAPGGRGSISCMRDAPDGGCP